MSSLLVVAIMGALLGVSILVVGVTIFYSLGQIGSQNAPHDRKMYRRAIWLRNALPVLIVLFLIDLAAIVVSSRNTVGTGGGAFSAGPHVD